MCGRRGRVSVPRAVQPLKGMGPACTSGLRPRAQPRTLGPQALCPPKASEAASPFSQGRARHGDPAWLPGTVSSPFWLSGKHLPDSHSP